MHLSVLQSPQEGERYTRYRKNRQYDALQNRFGRNIGTSSRNGK
jgi:hypothetical protein